LSDPHDLWDKMSNYLQDEQVFTPRADKKIVMKIGDYVESLLLDYNYYGTRLPRIPTTIEREIKAKIMKNKIFEKESKTRNEKHSDVKSRSRSRSRSRKHKKKKSRSRSHKRNHKKKSRKKDRKQSSSRGRHLRSRSRSRSRTSRSDSYHDHKKEYFIYNVNLSAFLRL
jgi:hypothetical protein